MSNVSEQTLIYEKSVSGRTGYVLPRTGQSEAEIMSRIPGKWRRTVDAALPEVSEPIVMRHYVNLSTKNHHIDKGFYPLGSCTMKYNPKMNDVAASMPGFADCHPLLPDAAVQGCLQIMYELGTFLGEVSGFPAISLQPVAGAQGEFAGLLTMRAYHQERGERRNKVIIPDSSHGTNPASVTAAGWTVLQIKSNSEGIISPEAVAEAMDETVVGMMMTNPNTLGLFESNIAAICRIVHAKGGLMYMDGANLNAHMGIFRPADNGFDMMHFNLHKTFSIPHGGGGPGAGAVGVVAALAKHLPSPVVVKESNGQYRLDHNRPHSIGRLHAYVGNFAHMVRAYAYCKAIGGKGLRQVSENAVLNANYVKALIEDDYDIPYDHPCMHEFVASGSRQKKLGVKTSDISKRLLDFGMHAPTNYFPLIVPEAMMIEPTETESRETLEQFGAVMRQIAREAETNPEIVTSAPHSTPVRRLDEATAARTLDIAFKG
jgi:glycine dehydrogenase subunit 2